MIVKKPNRRYYRCMLFIIPFIHLAATASAIDPYAHFPAYLELPSVSSTNIGIHQAPNKNIISVHFGGQLSCTTPNGEITQSTTEEKFRIKNVFWDTDNFVITTQYYGGRTPLPYYQIIRYSYNLQLEQMFDPRTQPRSTRSNDINSVLLFTAITKYNDYYYLGGINTDDDKKFIRRLNLDLSPDYNFNNDINGLIYIETNNFSGRILDILIHQIEGTIYIIISGYGKVNIFPIDDPENLHVLDLSLPSPSHTHAPIGITSCDNSSIFVASSNTIYKYRIDTTNNTPSLLLDTSFNSTGSISLNYSNHIEFSSIKKIGNFIFVEGDYNNGASPMTVCYNVSNPERPFLEKTFFNRGYIQSVGIITTDKIPSFFTRDSEGIERYKLNASFTQIFTNKFTISEKLDLLSSYNIPLPLIG